MPELPEVEVIRLKLLGLVKGKKIKDVKVFFQGSVAYPDIESFLSRIKGLAIKDINRHGKFLIFKLSKSLRLVVHLRMTGSLVYYGKGDVSNPDKHCRLIIYLDNGAALHYSDMRKFGRLWLVDEEETVTGICRLGPDWLNDYDFDTFKGILKKYPKAPIKRVLLDQSLMAGLGNIYVDESLFRASIHPSRPSASLKQKEKENLYSAVGEVLQEGIKSGGATIRDYKNADGSSGGFQELIRVYGRKGGSCFNCSGSIEKTVMCGRGTYYCSSCQK